MHPGAGDHVNIRAEDLAHVCHLNTLRYAVWSGRLRVLAEHCGWDLDPTMKQGRAHATGRAALLAERGVGGGLGLDDEGCRDEGQQADDAQENHLPPTTRGVRHTPTGSATARVRCLSGGTDSTQPASFMAFGKARAPVPTIRLKMKMKPETVPYSEPIAVSPAPPRPMAGERARGCCYCR
jgi:hypothetical protein